MDDMSEHPKYQWKPVFWMNNWFENYKEKNTKIRIKRLKLAHSFEMPLSNARKK